MIIRLKKRGAKILQILETTVAWPPFQFK